MEQLPTKVLKRASALDAKLEAPQVERLRPVRVGDQVIVNGLPHHVTYVHEGRQRFSLEPLPTGPAQAPTDSNGTFIHDQWLNGDPVWVIYKGPDCWLVTAHPQSIFHYAYGSKLAVAGEEPFFYGMKFVPVADLYPTRAEADVECNRRNGIR